MVTTTTTGGQRVTICTCTRTGRHLTTFTRRPGSSLYTLTTKPPQVAASDQVSASPPALACPALHSFRRGVAARRSSLLLVSPDYCSPADSPHGLYLRLRNRFREDFLDLRLHSNRGGEFSSDFLQDFCCGEGILQSFTLSASPQQNGVAGRNIGLVVGDASMFPVWGSRAVVRDTFADKLSVRAIPLVFLDFPSDAPGWQFYHPTLRRVLPSQDVTFHEVLLPQGPAPSSVSQVDPLPLAKPVEVTVDSGVAGGGAARGAASEGAESGGAEPRGTASAGGPAVTAGAGGTEGAGAAGPEGARTRGTGAAEAGGVGGARAGGPGARGIGARGTGVGDPGAGDTGAGGVGAGGAGTGGAGAGGPGAGDPGAGGAGAGGAGARGNGAGDPGAGGTGAGDPGAGEAGAEGAGSGGAGAGGTGSGGAGAGGTGAEGARAGGAGARGTSAGGAARARDPGAGGAGAGGAGAGGTGAGGTVQRRPFFVPPPPSSLPPPRSLLVHRPEHWEAAKKVLRYLCSTSGTGLVLGGRGPVVLTGHADAFWVDDLVTQRSSQGFTFSLSSGSVSWRSTRSSSVLISSCEAEIYARAMAAQKLRWLTYLLTDLGEAPRSFPVLYVDNKAMITLCQEHRLEHRTKYIALCYFVVRELQQRGQLRLAYVATGANTADIFTKALQHGDHRRFCTVLGIVLILPHLLTA
ncbi:unnamed protein product [Closterium sp. NIES-54]